ncbi:MAG: hypothetical protein V5B39_17090 [Accumulibacter sp.]
MTVFTQACRSRRLSSFLFPRTGIGQPWLAFASILDWRTLAP